MLGIVVSRADRASEHIGEHLFELADWTAREDASSDADGGGTVRRTDGAVLRTFDDLHLSLDRVADDFDADPDFLVFASRHSGETGPLLTAHHTGNFGPAEHGGDPNDLARACPNAHARVLDALGEHAPEGYEVGMECTHHGPSDVGVPSMFVEIGSGRDQWEDPAAARAVATAILDLRGVAPDRVVDEAPGSGNGAGGVRHRHLVGFGGGHYVPKFERIVRETDWAVGHIAADWGLETMGAPAENRGLLDRAFAASAAELAVVEGDRPDLIAAIGDLGYRVVGESWLRAVEGVPLALVDCLTETLVPVADGLRFGDPAREADPDVPFEVVDLPDDLLAEGQGIDQDLTRQAVTAGALAFETEEAGTRVAGRGAVVSRRDYDTLIEGLLDVLRTEYETVERRDGAAIARKTAFDPGKARAAGVPEGPKFGRLASGQPVEVDGETIMPAEVSSERRRRFEL